MTTQTNLSGIWNAFCFGCEQTLLEDTDFAFVSAIADLHAEQRGHLVGLTTWKDYRKETKEVPTNVTA